MSQSLISWDYIIVGQGLCGTLLGDLLSRAGKQVLFVDQGIDLGSSAGAAGLIQPLVGKRWTLLPDYALYLDHAKETYLPLEESLGESFWHSLSMRIFQSATENQWYERSRRRYSEFFHAKPDQDRFADCFSEPIVVDQVGPAWRLDARILLSAYREKLQREGRLLEERFDHASLNIEEDGLRYGHQKAKAVFFAEGAQVAYNPWFSDYPFAFDRGQALMIACEGIPSEYAYRSSAFLMIPWKKNQYWVGASHERSWDDSFQDMAYQDQILGQLRQMIGARFQFLHAWAGVRPSTIDRKPIWGFHPRFPRLGIINGMGSRAMLLAPYFASRFARQILDKERDIMKVHGK